MKRRMPLVLMLAFKVRLELTARSQIFVKSFSVRRGDSSGRGAVPASAEPSGARTQRARIAPLFGRLRTKPRAVFAAAGAVPLVVGVLLIAVAAQAETSQHGDLRVAFGGKLSPHALPRAGAAPVSVSVATRIATADGATPPQLRSISIAVNRHGRFDRAGLPVCSLADIQPATNANALAACGSALVGHGTFTAKVLLPQSSPFPSNGRLLAFNGSFDGRPAILAHVFGSKPIPTSYTIPFVLAPSSGTFGTTLTASLPQVTGNSGYITGLTLNLNRSFSSHGARHSYVSASCPAPRGIALVSFPFARASFGFVGRKPVTSTLTRSCKVRP